MRQDCHTGVSEDRLDGDPRGTLPMDFCYVSMQYLDSRYRYVATFPALGATVEEYHSCLPYPRLLDFRATGSIRFVRQFASLIPWRQLVQGPV